MSINDLAREYAAAVAAVNAAEREQEECLRDPEECQRAREREQAAWLALVEANLKAKANAPVQVEVSVHDLFDHEYDFLLTLFKVALTHKGLDPDAYFFDEWCIKCIAWSKHSV
jgi:hypothetical protein